jgi:preprotein translocase subunit SecF
MQIFKHTTFDIVSKQNKTLIASSILIVLAVIMLFVRGGVQVGIDFTGGVRAILAFDKEVEVSTVRQALSNTDFNNAEVKTFGVRKITISVQSASDDENEKLVKNLKSLIDTNVKDAKLIEEPSIQKISGKMSQELLERSAEAIEYALVLIALYIIVRFSTRQTAIGVLGFIIDYTLYKFLWINMTGMFIPLFVLWPIIKAGYAFGALAATFHDVIITISLLEIFGVEFNSTVIAALLTIIGYSLNDTIVVFDRIRENMAEVSPKEFTMDIFKENINKSINSTLNRTVITSLTTFFVVFILAIYGGSSLFPFAFALCIGVIVGTYSSVFIAAPIMMKRFEKEMAEVKLKLEEEEIEGKSEEEKNKILL